MGKNKKKYRKLSYFIIISMIAGIIGLNGNINIVFAEQTVTMEKYYGDINEDGKVDATDEQMLIRIVNGISSVTNDIRERCDLNGDGNITQQDVELIHNYNEESIAYFPVEPIFYGDLNLDGKITVSDLSAMISAQSSPLSDINKRIRADLNGDGNIDGEDLELIKNYLIGMIKYFPVQNMLKSIQIKTNPAKLQYNLRESLNTAGMTVEAYYNNGYHRTVTSWNVYGNTNTAGNVQIIVSYTEGAVSKTTSYIISVKDYTLKANPTSLTASSDGTLSRNYIEVNTDNTGNYNVTSNNSWLTVGTGSSKNNAKMSLNFISNNSFYVFADENTSTSRRTGTIKITHASDSTKSQTITVTQAGRSNQLTVNPVNITADSKGTLSQSYIEVNTNNTGNYNVISNNSWLTVGTGGSKNNAKMSLNSISNNSFYVFADENTSTSRRTGTIKITHASDSTKSQTITVTQAGRSNQLTVNPVNITADSKGTLSQNYIEVSTNNTGNYNVTSNDSWLTVGTGSSKNNAKMSLNSISNNSFYVFADENTSTSRRTGTIKITHASDSTKSQTITVTQAGRSNQLTVNPVNITADSKGTLSQSYIEVSTNNTGNYNVISNNSWLTVGTSSGKKSSKTKLNSVNNKKIYVFADENTSTSARSGTITITHASNTAQKQIVTVIQKEKQEENNTDDKQDDIILQEELKVSPDKLDSDVFGKFKDNQNKVTVTIRSLSSVEVDASSVSWLKVSKNNTLASSGNKVSFQGSADFYVFADENSSTVSREGDIKITVKNKNGDAVAVKTVKVTQSEAKGELKTDISKITANAKGILSIVSVKVSTNHSGGFTVDTGDQSWIKVANGDSESGASSHISFTDDGAFYVFVSENTESIARKGTITIQHENGLLKKEITVSQEGLTPVLMVDSTKKIAGQDGSFEQNKIAVKTEKTGGFTVTVKNGDWLRVSKSDVSNFYDGMTELSFTEDAVFYLMASKNTGSERSATLTVSHHAGTMEKTVEVVQTGAGNSYLRIDRETAYFDDPQAAVDAVRVKVTADESTTWTATTSDSWIELAENSSSTKYRSIEGTGNGEFYIHVKENGTYEEREGNVIVSAPGQESCEIYVHQVENEVDLVALLGELTVRVPRKTFGIKKSTKIILDYPEGLHASDIAGISYKSSKTKVATVNKKGVIKGRKKGKAVISVKVRLEEKNAVKIFKIKINVGKRKVKIGKIKGN